jgi:hypothetical protein
MPCNTRLRHHAGRPRPAWPRFAVLALGLLSGLARVQAQELAFAREALAAGDTAAAVRALERVAREEPLAAEALGALFLLDWIGRGAAPHAAAGVAMALRDRYLATWAPMQRDTMLPADGPDDGIRIVLRAWWDVEEQLSDPRVPRRRDGQPTDRPADLDSLAASLEIRAPPVAAAARWVQVRRLLRSLGRAAADVPPTPGPFPVCPGGCNTPRVPRPDDQLITRLSAEPSASALRKLVTLFRELERGPEPFNALGARAHVAVCALLLGAPPAGCWPRTDHLVGRDSAEVVVMAYVSQGRHGLASRVMDAKPAWFAPLDAQRDLFDIPDSVLKTDTISAPSRTLTTRLVAGPGSGPNLGLPVDVFWRLAWPLYLQPYNERLVVHRGRLLLADAVRRLSVNGTPLFAPVGDPVLIVRTGVPLAVVPVIGRGGLARQPGARSTRVYVPPGTHETMPGQVPSASWAPIDLALAVAQPPRYRWITGFVSEEYRVLGMVDHQLVHYVRDGRRHVDLYTSWAPPLRCPNPRPLLGLVLLDSALHERRRDLRIDLVEHPRARFSTIVDAGTYLYSLEMLDRACRVAQRTRYWITVPPAEGAFISDLMLVDTLFPSDTNRAAERVGSQPPAAMSTSLSVRAGGTVRLYWELYGVNAATVEPGRLAVTFEVVDTKRRRVAVSELGAVANQARRTHGALEVRYALLVPPGKEPLGSGIAVGMPPGTQGLYVARVTVTDTRTGRVAAAERAFFVR